MKKKIIKNKRMSKEEEHVVFIDRLTDIHMQHDKQELPKKIKKNKKKN